MTNPDTDPAQRQILHSTLQEIFANINEWLKFSEGKNAALSAFNVAAAVGVSTIINDMDNPALYYVNGFQIFVALNLTSSFISLASFFPRIRKLPEIEKSKVDGQASVIFFGHLAQMNSADFLDRLSTKIGFPIDLIDDYHRDQAYQIITNSKIARGKFLLFRIAIVLTALSIPLGLMPLGIEIMKGLFVCR